MTPKKLFRAINESGHIRYEVFASTAEDARAGLNKAFDEYCEKAGICVDDHDLVVFNDEMYIREIRTGILIIDDEEVREV